MNLIYHGRAPRIVCRQSERPANTIRGHRYAHCKTPYHTGGEKAGARLRYGGGFGMSI